jgi:hypothetical protein
MEYMLDPTKNNVGKTVFPLDGTTVIDNFEVQPDVNMEPVFTVDGKEIEIGGQSTQNMIKLYGGICHNFKQLTGADTNYDMLTSDYFVEVVSDTYNTVTLPLASTYIGCAYIISRGANNTNNKFRITTQTVDTIDGRDDVYLRRAGYHAKLISNGMNTWYII